MVKKFLPYNIFSLWYCNFFYHTIFLKILYGDGLPYTIGLQYCKKIPSSTDGGRASSVWMLANEMTLPIPSLAYKLSKRRLDSWILQPSQSYSMLNRHCYIDNICLCRCINRSEWSIDLSMTKN